MVQLMLSMRLPMGTLKQRSTKPQHLREIRANMYRTFVTTFTRALIRAFMRALMRAFVRHRPTLPRHTHIHTNSSMQAYHNSPTRQISQSIPATCNVRRVSARMRLFELFDTMSSHCMHTMDASAPVSHTIAICILVPGAKIAGSHLWGPPQMRSGMQDVQLCMHVCAPCLESVVASN